MLCCGDRELIERARFLSQQARDPAPHYEHATIGYNYRLSNVLAAIGRGQLRALDDRVRRKLRISAFHRKALGVLPGIAFLPEAPYGRSTRWLTVLTIDPAAFGADREAVRLALEKENIASRPVGKPMRLPPVFRGCRAVGVAVSEELFARGLSPAQLVHHEQEAQEGRDLELRCFRDVDRREVDFVVTEERRPLLPVACTWDDAEVDRGLRYLKARFPEAAAWQVSAVGRQDDVTPEGPRPAHASTV